MLLLQTFKISILKGPLPVEVVQNIDLLWDELHQ
jgi:hypothetical protein